VGVATVEAVVVDDVAATTVGTEEAVVTEAAGAVLGAAGAAAGASVGAASLNSCSSSAMNVFGAVDGP